MTRTRVLLLTALALLAFAANSPFCRVRDTAIVAATFTTSGWSQFFDVYEPMHAVVAERDGKPVGPVHDLFHRNTAMLAPVCYLCRVVHRGADPRAGRRPCTDRGGRRAHAGGGFAGGCTG